VSDEQQIQVYPHLLSQAVPPDLAAAIEIANVRLVPGAVEQLAALWTDMTNVSPALLPGLVKIRLADPRYQKFVAPAPPSAEQTPGTVQHAAQQVKAAGYGGLGRRVAPGQKVDLTNGMTSPRPFTHADLPHATTGPAPTPAQTIASLLAQRATQMRTGLRGPRTKMDPN
jgi:hypothetical protein